MDDIKAGQAYYDLKLKDDDSFGSGLSKASAKLKDLGGAIAAIGAKEWGSWAPDHAGLRFSPPAGRTVFGANQQ